MCETGKRQSGTKVRKQQQDGDHYSKTPSPCIAFASQLSWSVRLFLYFLIIHQEQHPVCTSRFSYLISFSLVVCGYLSAVFSVACNAVASVPIFDLPLRIEARPRDIPGPGSCSSNTSGTRRRPTNITCKLCPAARGGRL